MPRFFVQPQDISREKITLTGENNFHISRTLRMRKNQEIVISDMLGTDYICVLTDFFKDFCEAKIIKKIPCKTESQCKITLFQALPKSDKMEQIIQKSTEMGVFEIYPVITKRCISRPDEKAAQKKLERYQKIALEAAKQSQRGIVPAVHPIIEIGAICDLISQFDRTIIYYEKGGIKVKDIMNVQDKSIGIFVGSEGGFEDDEVDFLNELGAKTASLGHRILRCETAPIAAITGILSIIGEI